MMVFLIFDLQLCTSPFAYIKIQDLPEGWLDLEIPAAVAYI